MKSNSVPARAGALVLSCLASSAVARDWLQNPSPPAALPLPNVATLAVPFVNYGMRAQVRIIRPDGVYQIGEDYYRYGTEGPGAVEHDAKED
jgi:hypothetical protein